MLTPLTVRHFEDGALVNIALPAGVEDLNPLTETEMRVRTNGQTIADNYVYKKKQNGGYWMHYSFACPGVDLHNGNFDDLENWLHANCNQPNSNKSKQDLVQALFDYGLDLSLIHI